MLHFIELKAFSRKWAKLKLNDDVLELLQVLFMSNPMLGSVVEGTGGLRKARFSPPGWPRGKSGALRVCYVYFEQFQIIVFVTVYPKNEKDTLSKTDKKQIREVIKRIEDALSKGTYN